MTLPRLLDILWARASTRICGISARTNALALLGDLVLRQLDWASPAQAGSESFDDMAVLELLDLRRGTHVPVGP